MTATATPTALPRLATPEDTRACLTSRPVITMPDVLIMGQIRNACRMGFSADTTPIDDDRQAAWWRWNHHRVEAWLFEDADGAIVGYGALLQQPDGRWVSSVAVLPPFGGRGYGKAITTFVALAFDFPVYARARLDNPAAMALHDDLIWDAVTPDNHNMFYVTKPKIRRAQLACNLDHCGVLGQ